MKKTLLVSLACSLGTAAACSYDAPKVTVRTVDADADTNAGGPAAPAPKLTPKPPAPLASPKSTDSAAIDLSKSPYARPVTWAVVNEKVIAPRCATCHSSKAGASGGLDLSTYAAFKGVAPTAFGLTFFVDDPAARMPKGGVLTPLEKQVFADYVVDGLQP